MKNIIILLFLGLVCSNIGCYKDIDSETEFNDEFYLSHNGADLPIWVRGKKSAKTFILFLHGGPYDTGLFNAVRGHFESLHEDYAVVYFDQRGGGFSHGGQENNNEAQFVEDVEVVLALIQEKYPEAENLFLMGHSYGGYLGTAVLAKNDNQDLFKGWIELAGNHNFPFNWLASRAYCIDIAQEKIADGIETEKWSDRLERLINTPAVNNLLDLRMINGTAFQIARDINEGNTTFENPSFLYQASSPIGAGFGQHNTELLEDFLVTANLNPVMSNITIPSLLVYGGEDPIVPPAVGANGMEFLGTPEEDKSLIILETSGHELWEFQADILFDQIRTFISKYE